MEEQKPLAFIDELNPSQTNNAIAIAERAKKMGLNPRLAVSIAYAESRLNSASEDSDKGAIGMMQVMPETGKMLGFSEKDLRDPQKNIEAGLMYLKQGYDKFNDPVMTAAGYHAGFDHKFFEDPEKHKLGPKTTAYIKDINSWGGFTAPTESIAPSESAAAPAFKTPPAKAPASEEGFLESKAKDLMFDASRWAENQTPQSLAEAAAPTAGAMAGAYASNKMGQGLDYMQARKPATGGDLWRENWAGQGGERRGLSVPEAAAGYQRSKGQGKVTSQVTKMYGPPTTTTEPGVFKPGRLSLARPMQSPLSPLAGKMAEYGGAVLNSPIGRKVTGALGGYGAAQEGMEAYRQARQGDVAGAAISGLGALGGALTAVPTAPTRAIGVGLSTLTPAAQWMLQHSRKMSPEAAQGALQRTDPMGNPIP